MRDFATAWWPIFFWIYLPRLTRLVAGAIAQVAHARLDRAIPDDLPRTAGQWLADELEACGLAPWVRSVVTDETADVHTDGFHPGADVVQLRDETHFKADPVYWGIAGHELGHAWVARRAPLLTGAFAHARWGGRVLVVVGLGLAFGNLFASLPGVSSAAYACVVAGAILAALQLVDEASASLVGLRHLRRSSALGPRHLRAVRLTLLSAFGTYLASFVAGAVLLTQWGPMLGRVGDGAWIPHVTLTAASQVALVACCAIVVAYAAAQLALVVAPGPARRLVARRPVSWALIGFLWQASLLVLLALAWDRRTDPAYARAVILAAIPTVSPFAVLLALPLLPAFVFLERRVRRALCGHGVDWTREYATARRAGRDEIRRGNQVIAAIVRRLAEQPPWRARLAGVLAFAPLPLVFACWPT